MIAENAHAAWRLESSLTHDTAQHPQLRRRQRARMAERVIAMLGVPPVQVAVAGDLLGRFGPWPGAVATVIDPDTGTRYRFLARPGEEGSTMLLLDECAECSGVSVPVAEIETLADLGRYLAAMGRLEPESDSNQLVGGSINDLVDAMAPPIPIEYFGDPGHDAECPAAVAPHE